MYSPQEWLFTYFTAIMDFNEKKSTFNLFDESGAVSSRGKFYNELNKGDYDKVGSIFIEDLKSVDLTPISSYFPNVTRITIKKADLLSSLNGISGIKNLKDLSIESEVLTDFNSISKSIELKTLDIENCPKSYDALEWLPGTLTHLILNANYTRIADLSKFTALTNLTIYGEGSDLGSFPEFPASIKKLSLRGFPKFRDGSCFKNLSTKVYLNNMLDNEIENLPESLSGIKWFIHPSKR